MKRGRPSTQNAFGFTATEQRVRAHILANSNIRESRREFREKYADIAAACGCSRATVCRTVTKMEERGDVTAERLRFEKGKYKGAPAWKRLTIRKGTRRLPRAHPSSSRAAEGSTTPDPIFWNGPNRNPASEGFGVAIATPHMAAAPPKCREVTLLGTSEAVEGVRFASSRPPRTAPHVDAALGRARTLLRRRRARLGRELRWGETVVAILCGAGWVAGRQRRFEVGQAVKVGRESLEAFVAGGLLLLAGGGEIDWNSIMRAAAVIEGAHA